VCLWDLNHPRNPHKRRAAIGAPAAAGTPYRVRAAYEGLGQPVIVGIGAARGLISAEPLRRACELFGVSTGDGAYKTSWVGASVTA
jgi:hypothetical protein